MKTKVILSVLLIGIVLTISCKKLLTFDISDSTTTTVDANILPFQLPVELPTPDVTTNSENEFAQNDTKVELVKEIILKKLELTITSPSDKTFSFLKSIEIYISADGEDEMKLAWNDDVQSNAKNIELETTNSALDKYVKKDKYKLRTKVVTKETLTQSVDIKIDFTFQVTADPF
ncbi:MAG: hypothetical protein DRI94_00240 [Bacteroidetes bacterium]|nr:MAG: hypothetical protein DRI94_00240 [Bacteroidota bacterium]